MSKSGTRNPLNLKLPSESITNHSTASSPGNTQPASGNSSLAAKLNSSHIGHPNVKSPGGSNVIIRSQPPTASPNGQSNRSSTAPVDVTEVQRQLESQEMDDSQRQKLIEFVAQKKNIGELNPEDFERLSELGKGNGGVVSKVLHKQSNLIMAKKNIHLEIKPAIRAQIIRELQVLHDCNSPYIVGYYGAFFLDGDISICMEYMDGGSLDLVLKKAGRIPEPIVARITYSVLKGLNYLRDCLGIIHRDVKPSNILVNREGEVKLCDFGVSGQLIDSMANSFVGTRSYMAPERLTAETYNILSDVWSLGLSLIELATGCYPIPSADVDQYLEVFSPSKEANIEEHHDAAKTGKSLKPVRAKESGPMAIFEQLSYIVDQPPPTVPNFAFSDLFLDFVDNCIKKDPSERYSLDSLMSHDFSSNLYPTIDMGVYLRTILGDG